MGPFSVLVTSFLEKEALATTRESGGPTLLS